MPPQLAYQSPGTSVSPRVTRHKGPGLSVLVWPGPSVGRGGVPKQTGTVSLSNESKQVSACEAECILS